MQGEKVGEERKWKSGENKSEREKKKRVQGIKVREKAIFVKVEKVR